MFHILWLITSLALGAAPTLVNAAVLSDQSCVDSVFASDTSSEEEIIVVEEEEEPDCD